MLKDVAEFRSERFAPVLPEECQVNPGRYGAELAFWLSLELAQRGVATSYPQSEDWGWFIEYTTDTGSEFAVHCGNVDGTTDRWLVSLRRFGRKMFGRDKPSFTDARPLVACIARLIGSEPDISHVRWLYDDGDRDALD